MPLLTLVFVLPLREAVAISLVAVIVTSSASAAVYLQRHVANLRLGMTLELFSAIGALVGGLIAFADRRAGAGGPVRAAPPLGRRVDGPPQGPAEGRARAWRPRRSRRPPECPRRRARARAGARGDRGPRGWTWRRRRVRARLHRRPLGARLPGPPPPRAAWSGRSSRGSTPRSWASGAGSSRCPSCTCVMGVPLRTSTATSNMMMGITATASAVIYLLRDEIDPFVAGPIALGRLHRGVGGLAPGAPGRRPRPALAVRGRPRLHRRPDGASGPWACEPGERSGRRAGRRLRPRGGDRPAADRGHVGRDGPRPGRGGPHARQRHRPARARRRAALRPRGRSRPRCWPSSRWGSCGPASS